MDECKPLELGRTRLLQLLVVGRYKLISIKTRVETTPGFIA